MVLADRTANGLILDYMLRSIDSNAAATRHVEIWFQEEPVPDSPRQVCTDIIGHSLTVLDRCIVHGCQLAFRNHCSTCEDYHVRQSQL